MIVYLTPYSLMYRHLPNPEQITYGLLMVALTLFKYIIARKEVRKGTRERYFRMSNEPNLTLLNA